MMPPALDTAARAAAEEILQLWWVDDGRGPWERATAGKLKS